MGRPRGWGSWKGEQGVGQSDAGPGPTGQRGSPEALLQAAIVPLKACSLGAEWSGQKGKASSSTPKNLGKRKAISYNKPKPLVLCQMPVLGVNLLNPPQSTHPRTQK